MSTSQESAVSTSAIPKFDGTNYYVLWKFQLKVILEVHELLGVVEATEVKPEEAAGATSWSKKDAKARMLISTTMTHTQLRSLITCVTATEMWSRLAVIFERKTESCKLAAQQRFFSYTMEPRESMTSHIAHVEALAMELKGYGETVSESMVMAKLLGSLPPKYLHLVTAWESVGTYC